MEPDALAVRSAVCSYEKAFDENCARHRTKKGQDVFPIHALEVILGIV